MHSLPLKSVGSDPSPLLLCIRLQLYRRGNDVGLRKSKMSRWRYMFVITALVLLTGLDTANATDLSEGIKGLKLGTPKTNVLAMLDSMTKEAGGIFAPACEKDIDGERCVAIGNNLSYGKAEIAFLSIHFSFMGLDQVTFLLSMAGCKKFGDKEAHPTIQFERISDLLTQHFGPPTVSKEHRNMWADKMAFLKISLQKPDSTHELYPTCPSTTVEYVSRIRANVILNQIKTKQAKERDL